MPPKGRVGAHRKKTGITVFAVTGKGLALAGRISVIYPDAVVSGPDDIKRGGLKQAVDEAFSSSKALFFIGAVGIAVRMIAPLLKGKHLDPAVVVMDDGGRFVISLLSGHLGGANELARELAAVYGAEPVITTATDAAGLACAEDISKAFSLAIQDPKKIKRVNSAILKGSVVLVVDADRTRLRAMRGRFKGQGPFRFCRSYPASGEFGAIIMVTPFEASGVPAALEEKTLVMRPREFVLGIGCGKGVSAKEVRLAFEAALEKTGISPLSIKSVATIDIKGKEPAIMRFALKAGLDINCFSGPELDKVRPPSGRSKIVRERTGTGSVCESAALISAGVKRIWLRKQKRGRVAVALARARFTS